MSYSFIKGVLYIRQVDQTGVNTAQLEAPCQLCDHRQGMGNHQHPTVHFK